MKKSSGVLFLDDISFGRRVKLARVAMGLTQWQVAALATECLKESWRSKVQPLDISYLERDWGIVEYRRTAILTSLGMSDD